MISKSKLSIRDIGFQKSVVYTDKKLQLQITGHRKQTGVTVTRNKISKKN